MDTPPVQSPTAATSPSSQGAGNSSPRVDASNEDSKFKDLPMDQNTTPTDINMLTIEDSTLAQIPIHLENLFLSLDINEASPADLLITISYGISLECSFAAIDQVQKFESALEGVANQTVVSGFHSKLVRLLSNMPCDIYDANKMSYTLRLQLYFDRTGAACLMTGILTGDFLILTLTPNTGNSMGKSICLSIGRYVLNAKGRPFASRLRKLPELSFKLREHLLVPVRKHLIQNDGIIFRYPCLECLPEELYPYLYVYLTENNLNKLGNVCKRLLITVASYKIYKKRSFRKRP